MLTAEDILRQRNAARQAAAAADQAARRAAAAAKRAELLQQVEAEVTAAATRLAQLPTPYEGGLLLPRWLGGRNSDEQAVWHVATHRNGDYHTHSYYLAPTLGAILVDHTRRNRETAKNPTQQRENPQYHDAVHANWLMLRDLESIPVDDLPLILDGLRQLGQPASASRPNPA